MVTAASAAVIADLCTALIAVEILSFIDPQQLFADPSPSAQATLVDSAVALLMPLAALGALATAATAIYRHLQHFAAAAGAAGTRRLGRLFALLCGSVGTLEFFFFVQPAGTVGGEVAVAAHARALGLAAARVLPAAAAATFFLGVALIIVVVAHIRAGGEGGGGGFAAAADGQQIQGPVSFLTKAAFAAAAALIWLMAMALCVCGGDTAMIY